MCTAQAITGHNRLPTSTVLDNGGASSSLLGHGDDSTGNAGLPQLCCGCLDASSSVVATGPLLRRGSLAGLSPSEVMLALHDFVPPGNVCVENPTPLDVDDGVYEAKLPPIVDQKDVDAELIAALPVVPAAPDLDFKAALASMLAAQSAHEILHAVPEKDEDKTDPDSYVCPMVFKARHKVPWYKRWFNLCCGCVLSKMPSTRRYNLTSVEVVKEGDNRLTAGLSHTMLRQDPRLAVYSIVNYDQYDEEMDLVNVDPVTFAKTARAEAREIRIPVVVLQDLMAKNATDSVSPALLSQVYDSLIRVVNVPFNKDLELKINFTMFCQDYLMWLRDYRSALGFQNFQQLLLT